MDSMKIVVRAPNWVGDSILAFPAMTSLKNNFPDAEVWVAAQDWVKDLFSMNDTFAGVLPLAKHGGLKSIRESAKNIRDLRFDLGILFTNSFASALVFFLAF
jgi:heptosyltransferase-2